MIIKRIAGATRTIGQSQGFLGLPIRDEIRDVTIGDDIVKCQAMVTAWEPTPDEIERVKAGAPIYLCILGRAHPPVMLDVGEASDIEAPPQQEASPTDLARFLAGALHKVLAYIDRLPLQPYFDAVQSQDAHALVVEAINGEVSSALSVAGAHSILRDGAK